MATTITTSALKKHLVGLNAWFEQAAAVGTNYDDAYITGTIVPAAIRRFEEDLDLHINQTQVCCYPDGTYCPAIARGGLGSMGGVGGSLTSGFSLPSGTPYRVETPYTFWRNDFQKLGMVRLNRRPVLQAQRYRFSWNIGQDIVTFPADWIHWDFESGDCWLLPYQGSATIGQAYEALAIIQAGIGSMGNMPGVLAMDYVAGLDANWQTDPQWSALERALEECCAYMVLEDLSQVFDADVAGSSVSVAGFSQNINWNRFADRKAELKASYMGYGQNLQRDTSTVLLGVG